MMNEIRCHCQSDPFMCLAYLLGRPVIFFCSFHSFQRQNMSSSWTQSVLELFCSILSTTLEHISTVQWTLWSPKIPSFRNSEIWVVPFIHFIAHLRSSELCIYNKTGWHSEFIFFLWLIFGIPFAHTFHISMAQQRQNEGIQWATECVNSTFWMKTKVEMKYDPKKLPWIARAPACRYLSVLDISHIYQYGKWN